MLAILVHGGAGHWAPEDRVLAVAGVSRAAAVGWHLTWRSPLLWLLRELALPVLWAQAWLGNGLSWRGQEMSLEPGTDGLGAPLRAGFRRLG